jgi:hypothetical protein
LDLTKEVLPLGSRQRVSLPPHDVLLPARNWEPVILGEEKGLFDEQAANLELLAGSHVERSERGLIASEAFDHAVEPVDAVALMEGIPGQVQRINGVVGEDPAANDGVLGVMQLE